MKKFKVDVVTCNGCFVAMYVNGVYACESYYKEPSVEDLCQAIGVEIQKHFCNDNGLTSEGKYPKHMSRIKGLDTR